ncbi:hypothetical protein EJB10_04235 [Wolbachia endosymbiont of Brugia malayi]|uniref:hypothetical protein n=1 Tax=unclassified Wolbachia TaxID=2640676 RepID=UPI00004C9386|nr:MULTISPECIES: hypothetical protein [unclassified Wolbachia]AAW70965.1 Uncharacterized conserved protein [Wolbachia endosymbiont strain TRS of Brugia malayi]QCB61919.1 hypothetical protein EJB10_04235 [Wolbachia endosymbiont of Brugia malayi]QIT36365.1 hypothetical protein WBP_0386 [Wolbachia endosymbiont of Brugia pahangi]
MAADGKAKTASKNNPTQRKKAEQKMYKNKPVKPVRYIDRDSRMNYISAQYDNGNLVEDEVSGNPIKWEAV